MMKKQRRQALRARLPKGCPATLPLCHDWTGVVALPPLFTLINTKGETHTEGMDFLGEKI
jgi:hypothetical protein